MTIINAITASLENEPHRWRDPSASRFTVERDDGVIVWVGRREEGVSITLNIFNGPTIDGEDDPRDWWGRLRIAPWKQRLYKAARAIADEQHRRKVAAQAEKDRASIKAVATKLRAKP